MEYHPYHNSQGGSTLSLLMQRADGRLVPDKQEPFGEDHRDRARQEAVHGEP